MKQYFTCDGCNLIYVEDELNALDNKWVYCVTCLMDVIKEQIEGDDEDEDAGETPRRPWP
jgi:hypothetical protein